MKQMTLSLDISRCSACMSCVVACHDQNDFAGEEVAFRHVTTYEEGGYPSAQISSISIACFHCGDAPCQNVCPTNAIFKREDAGVIDVNRDLCIGCRSCEMACPFGAPKFSNDGKMAKCDMCYLRVAHDMEPACVQVCTTKALKLEPIKEMSSGRIEKASINILKSYQY